MFKFSKVARNIVAAGIIVLLALSVSAIGFSNWITNRNDTDSESVNGSVSVGNYVGVDLSDYITIGNISTPAYGDHGFDDGASSFTYVANISVPVSIMMNTSNTPSTDYDGIYSVLTSKGQREDVLSSFYIETTMHIANDNLSQYLTGVSVSKTSTYYAYYYTSGESYTSDAAHEISVTSGSALSNNNITFTTNSTYNNFAIYRVIYFTLNYTFNVQNQTNFDAIRSTLKDVSLYLEVSLGGITQ